MDFNIYGFINSAFSITDLELQDLEKYLNIDRLPEPYRDFLLQTNGGRFPVSRHFDPIDKEDEDDVGSLHWLYGVISSKKKTTLYNSSLSYGFRDGVPDRLIAIGDDTGIEQVCISTSGHDAGYVYWWTPLEAWTVHEQTMNDLRLIAYDFESFFKSLYIPDEE